MNVEITVALVVFVLVLAWLLAIWRRAQRGGSLPDVGTAPSSAEPIAHWRYNDDGLAMHLRPRTDADDGGGEDVADRP